MADAVRYFTPDRPHVALTVADKLKMRMDALARQIIDGTCQDFADYRHRCGQVMALRHAIAVCEDEENK